MPHEQIELEFTFRPQDDAVLPDLSVLPDVESVDTPQAYDLEAVYFDTPDLSLAQSGLTLRRRTGGSDEGWHLKVPTVDGNGRTEIGVPLGRAVRTPPKPLRTAAFAWTRNQPLVAVATLRTKRRVHQLRAPDGSLLAELCDDNVQGESLLADSPDQQVWREWELEVGTGSDALVQNACALLAKVAGKPVPGGSKLLRILRQDMPRVARPSRSKLKRSSSARAVVARRLSEQVDALRIHDSEVRRDAPGGIHQARVTIRRLRTALATFRPLLDRSKTDPLRAELQWVGKVLGDARDAEVLRLQLHEHLEREPTELVLGGVRRRIDRELKSAYQDARAQALEAMESAPYIKLLDDLDELTATGAWTADADRPARDVLPGLVRPDWKRLRKRVRATHQAGSEVTDDRLHEARKAAKRVRYAAETLQPVYGNDAKRLVKRMKKVQSALGDSHDSVVARQVLRELGTQAHHDGDNTFTFGRLHALEQARGIAAKKEFEKAWRAAAKPQVHSWLG